VYIICSYCVSD